jgi:hypothetical protein
MAGTNYGAVYQETFGTTSPVSGSAPSGATDGQPMDGLFAVRLVVSSGSGTTLSGAGTLQAYIFEQNLVPVAREQAASSDATTFVCTASALTAGFVVGMTVTGSSSGATGVITSIGGTGNKTITCSGGVTGSVTAGELLVGVDPGRWVRCPALDSATVASGARDETFVEIVLSVPRKGRIKWVPNGVTFSAGSAGITITQLGQTNLGLHDAGRWGA